MKLNSDTILDINDNMVKGGKDRHKILLIIVKGGNDCHEMLLTTDHKAANAVGF